MESGHSLTMQAGHIVDKSRVERRFDPPARKGGHSISFAASL